MRMYYNPDNSNYIQTHICFFIILKPNDRLPALAKNVKVTV